MPSENLKGKIKSVSVQNFVTYTQCVFCPNEYLNVIIGPNGTGKSTLVAAIVIGLAGDPKLLSRSNSVQDYIKNGKTEAHIEIKIYGEDRNSVIVFERSFNDRGKSEFKVNGETKTKKGYISEVQEFRIQIGNLCQFLPQDRVHDFTKMNPQELFVNTIKSVCSEAEIQKFEELKALRSQQSSRKERLERDTQNLRNITARVEELKVVLERHTKRKQFVDKLKVCEAKQNWLEIDEFDEKRKAQAKDKANSEKLLKTIERQYENIKKKQEAVSLTKKKLKSEAERKSKMLHNFLENINTVENEIERYTNQIKAEKNKFDMSKRENITARRELQNEIAIFEGISQDLKNLKNQFGSTENYKAELQRCVERMQHFHTEIRTRMKRCEAINGRLDEQYSSHVQMLKGRIERANNVKDKKLQLLKTHFPKVFTAVQWLQKNQNLFKGKVYCPMLLELNVIDPNNAKYVENTIPIRDLLAFTCENKSDVSLLIDELCVKQQLGVNVVHSLPATTCGYQNSQTIGNLSQYGFSDYLIDLIEGPASILNYLCSLYNLHKIPIGSERVSEHTDQIPSNIRLYFGGNKRYNSAVSRYSGETLLMQSHIEGKKLLCSVDTHQVEAMKKELSKLLRETDTLKNERSAIESEIKNIEVQTEEVRNQKRSLDSKMLTIKQTTHKVEIQKQKVERLRSNIIDIPVVEKKYLTETARLIKCKRDHLKERNKVLNSYQGAVTEKKFAQHSVAVYNEQSEDLLAKLKDVSDQRKSVMETHDTIISSIAMTEKKFAAKLSQAKESTKGCAPNERNFPYKNEFNSLPNTLAELKDQINEYNARLECMTDVDESLIKEYEDKIVEIEKLRESISEMQTGESQLNKEIGAMFNSWITNINSIVEIVNQQFSNFMASMQYVGEIGLARKDIYDFDSYGIQIMVQYRKEVALQALNRHTQSGGERAVAIAVYTLSLQHITHVPFRCVDEINQGMDPRNERKIFEMLVQETTKDGRSQYFFVTPKLLPGLTYNSNMMVHIVFNGKFVKSGDAM